MSTGVLCSPHIDAQTERQADWHTDTKVNTEDTLSGFQEFFLKPIIKDRSNIFYFPMSQGSFNPKTWFLCQKVCSVAHEHTHGHSEYRGHPFRVSGIFPSTYHKGSVQYVHCLDSRNIYHKPTFLSLKSHLRSQGLWRRQPLSEVARVCVENLPNEILSWTRPSWRKHCDLSRQTS